jgi:hypothetical protein
MVIGVSLRTERRQKGSDRHQLTSALEPNETERLWGWGENIHNDVELFPLPFSIESDIVSSFDTEDDLEPVSDGHVRLAVLGSKVDLGRAIGDLDVVIYQAEQPMRTSVQALMQLSASPDRKKKSRRIRAHLKAMAQFRSSVH